ncbi:MAG: serine/threonine-protein kinase [Planctomycetota bacterium]|jgi:tRNA A-37 threonylcarbamoyl transferase component Bud32
MAAGNEILFGRIAVHNGLVTVEQLDECLDLQRERAPSKHIGQIMIERGLIDEIQARAVLGVQRRRLHRGSRSAQAASEKRLCETLVRERIIDQKTISRARRSKEEMEERGLFPSLGDILVQQGSLSLTQLSAVQAGMARRELWCVSCGKKYRAHGYRPGLDARCRRCGGRLEPRDVPAPAPPEGRDITDEIAPPAPAATPEPSGPSEPAESFEDQLPSDLRERRPTSEAFEPKVGDVIGGRCRLDEMIGEGAWGNVYRARDLVLDREVAVKVLAPRRAGAPHLVQRFLSEARAAARLTHANIVMVHDVGEERGVYYMNMHFIRGKSVQQLIKERGRFEVREALGIVRQTAEALDYAHRKQMVHRDVKPGNIMLDESGQVTIVDFGLTKHMGADAHLTAAGMVVGTVHYMSPEQADGRTVDGRSDLYSLGVTLFEMLTGRVPFKADTPWKVLLRHQKEPAPDPTTLRPELPEQVSKLVLKLMAKDPAARPATGADLARAIDAIVRHM